MTDATLGTQALLDALRLRIAPRADRSAEFARHKAATDEAISEVTPYIAYLRAIRAALPEDGLIVEEITQIGLVRASDSRPTSHAPM